MFNRATGCLAPLAIFLVPLAMMIRGRFSWPFWACLVTIAFFWANGALLNKYQANQDVSKYLEHLTFGNIINITGIIFGVFGIIHLFR